MNQKWGLNADTPFHLKILPNMDGEDPITPDDQPLFDQDLANEEFKVFINNFTIDVSGMVDPDDFGVLF